MVLVVLSIGVFCRSTFGFGDALIAMPLLYMIPIERELASPMVALASVVIAISILLQNLRKLDFSESWILIVSACVGIQAGLWFLKEAPKGLAFALLGLILVAFSIYSLSGYQVGELKNKHWGWFFGFTSGALSGAWNTSGPPVVLYGTLKRWPPEDFRAKLQDVLLPTNVVLCFSHWNEGLWTPQVGKLFVYMIPIMAVVGFLGAKLNGMIPAEKFRPILLCLLLVLGLLLWKQAYSLGLGI